MAIPQRFELKHFMRQNLADKTLITTLKELQLGICSPETEGFFKSLDRPLEGILFRMPGDLLTVDCVDEGNVTGISCPAKVKLLLKVGAKVMIVWNLSEDVKNGTTGHVTGHHGVRTCQVELCDERNLL